METLLMAIGTNALVGTILAAGVAAIGTRWKNPGVLHVLWLLVLAKMLVPPALELRLLPHAWPSPSESSGFPSIFVASPPTVSSPDAIGEAYPGLTATPDDRLGALRGAVLLALGLGSASVLTLTVYRTLSFRRRLRPVRPAPERLARRVDEIAAAMGLSRSPRLRIVDGRIPPVVWWGPPCEILLPAELVDALSDDERDAMIAHELGHVRRGDHWTRGVELLAVAAFWWHPVVWWARRRLRDAEEACCDALVIRTLGDRSRAYAGALLRTLEFLTRSPHRPVPALATGADDFHRLQERLTMIVRRNTSAPLSPRKHRLILGLALAALTVGPSWSAGETQDETAAPPAVPGTPPPVPSVPVPIPVDGDPELVAALEALQKQSAELAIQAARLDHEREVLQLRMQELESQRHAMDMLDEAKRLQSQGDAERAALLREQADLLRKDVELRRREIDREHERNLAQMELEQKMQALEMRRVAAELAAQTRAISPDAD